MTTRSRALLIVAGILIFIVAAPMAVFFAKGIRYNFETGAFEKTGALIIRSDPRGADVLLNGEAVAKTPVTKRFLLPEQYDLEITKEGFRPWKTKVTVHPQMVSSASPPGTDRVFLLSEAEEPAIAASSTAPFYETEDRIYFLKQARDDSGTFAIQLWEMNKSSQEPVLVSQQQGFLSRPEILQALGEEAIIKDGSKNWYLTRGDIFLLPAGFSGLRLAPRPETILAINQSGQLVNFNPKNSELSVLAGGVLEFTVSQGEIYAIVSQSGQNQLVQVNGPDELQVLAGSLPRANAKQIFVSADRQILLLLDRTLYRIREGVEKIDSEVDYARWDDSRTSLAYGNQSESWLLSPLDGSAQLITRTASRLGPAVYNAKTGYTIIRTADKLLAILRPGAGLPGSYQLADIGTADFYTVNPDGNQVIYQSGQEIYVLEIR